jgi:general secretion pathway protein J
MEKRGGRYCGGFTLLEILIAIAILSVILSVIYGSYHSSVQTIQAVQASSDLYRSTRLILDIMSEDIRGAYISRFTNPSQAMMFAFVGEDHWDGAFPADTLNFTSTTRRLNDSDQPLSIFAEIGYFLETDEKTGRKKLMRRESYVVDQDVKTGGTSIEMGLWVLGLDLKYVDANNNTWDFWDSTAGEHAKELPKMVEIHLLMERGEDLAGQPPLEIFTKVCLEMAQS